MNDFERKVRNALRRLPAPEGFAEKVLARTRGLPPPGTKPRRQYGAMFAVPAFRWTAAAILVCLLIVAAAVHHRRQVRLRQEGEMARAQVMQALRIASVKLNLARKRVQDIGREASAKRL